MAGTSTDVKLGSCWVEFGTVAGNVGEVVDLGYTKGGVTVTMETGSYEILVDQEGDSPIGASITGRRVTVIVPMAESNYNRLQKLIPDSAYSAGLLEVNSGIGDDLMDYADELKLTSKADSDDWIKVYKASPVANLQATFLPNTERIWPVQFIGYIPEATHTYAGKLIAFHEAT